MQFNKDSASARTCPPYWITIFFIFVARSRRAFTEVNWFWLKRDVRCWIRMEKKLCILLRLQLNIDEQLRVRESKSRENECQWWLVNVYLSKCQRTVCDELSSVSWTTNCRQIIYNNLKSLLIRTDNQNGAASMVWLHGENSYNWQYAPIHVLIIISVQKTNL
jgi:hypothetical protein